MADSKITDLTEKTALDGSEEFVANDGGTDKKIGMDYLSGAMPFMLSGYKSGVVYPPTGLCGIKSGHSPTKDRVSYVLTTIGVPTTFTGIGINVGVGSSSTGTMRLGIYDTSDDGQPGTLVADWGTVDVTSTGVKTITISETLYGNYWLAGVYQGTGSGLNLSGYAADDVQTNGYNSSDPSATRIIDMAVTETGVSGALPSTATPAFGATHAFALMYLSV